MAELRQRRNRTNNPSSEDNNDKKKKSEHNPQDGDQSDDQETLWETFMSHPLGFCLVKILPVVMLSYGLYIGYYFVLLQHPHWISSITMGLVQLRPALSPMQQERQVLIVGTMSSGTTQVASDLKTKLGLEIGHEESDAQWNFVRDGTVSWFHGIRFLPPHATSTELLETMTNLCVRYNFNMGFHPQMYHATSKCSSRFSKEKWNSCWVRECMDVIQAEWNCAASDDIHNNCPVTYAYNLHQVRNPLRTMESLVAKFCIGGIDGDVQPAFVTLLKGLFPTITAAEDLSCIEAAAFYVLNYTNALLQAQKDGYIDALYKVEQTSPCQVASLAGLYNATTTLYKPNHYDLVMKRCSNTANLHDEAQKAMTSSEHRINVDKQVSLTWSDLQGGKHGSQRPDGATDLEQDVRELFIKLGYDPVQEVQEEIFDF